MLKKPQNCLNCEKGSAYLMIKNARKQPKRKQLEHNSAAKQRGLA
jgi:hypothetical protein